MMDNLRAAANHVVLKIILALIILSFVLTGVGNYLIGGSGDYAAKVNGQTIERAQLEQAFQSERSRMQQQLGDQFSALAGNEGYMQQMRRQVLSQLIDNMLLDQYARSWAWRSATIRSRTLSARRLTSRPTASSITPNTST